MPLLFCSFPVEPSRPAQRRTPSGDNMFVFKPFKAFRVAGAAKSEWPQMGGAAARGLCAAARFGASRGGPRRFRGEAKRPLKMMESCGHCVAGCRVQNTPRFPVGRRGKPERPPYAAALTLFSGVRNSDVSARQAGGGTRIAAVHTLILYAVVSRCTESRNFSRRRRGKFE